MNDPKVSIVIPVYKGEDFLAEAIDSALAQTYDNIEIVVVDDGSDDDGATLRVAQSYGDKVRLFSKPNGGVASALNRAITEMTGDYFSWLSHDDLYTEDKVEKELRALHALGRDDAVIYSDYAVFTDNPKDALPVHLKGVPPEQFRYWITVENQLHGCTLLIPRRAFDKVGGFDESLRTTQDYDLWYRMAKEFPFVHIPEVLVKFRSHPGQGSNTMADIARAECDDLCVRFIVGLDENDLRSSAAESLGDAYAEIAASMFRRKFDQAGLLAKNYAKQHGWTERNWTVAIQKPSRFRAGLMDIGRKYIPQKLKYQIKAAIRLIANRVQRKRN